MSERAERDEKMWGDSASYSLVAVAPGTVQIQPADQLVYVQDVPRVWSLRFGLLLSTDLAGGEQLDVQFMVTTGVGKASFQQVVIISIPGPRPITGVVPWGFYETTSTIPDQPARSIVVVVLSVKAAFVAPKTINCQVIAAASPYSYVRGPA